MSCSLIEHFETLLDNVLRSHRLPSVLIKTKVAFATEDIHDAEYISKLLGTRTIKVFSGSVSTQTRGDSESTSYHSQASPLLRPDEIMKLPGNQTLIMRTGYAPVKARQLIWYKNLEMKSLPCGESLVPQQEIKTYPFIRQNATSIIEDLES